jgi:hypothetical protein
MRLFIMCASMSPQPSPAAIHLVYERRAGDSTSRRKKGLREQATHDGMSLRRLLADMIEEYAGQTDTPSYSASIRGGDWRGRSEVPVP